MKAHIGADDESGLVHSVAGTAASVADITQVSTEYKRTRDKLHWLCHRGHSWHSAFANIRSGRWCQICKHISRLSSAIFKVRQRYENYDR